ncbi:uncharacterized protein PAC_17928 [Phialocephala subalpina]|uniref:FAD/NAD(P)-binding domain-containing protein n=1 Tax=Phialocephala subalpina TaxID=576137 RepID=A0A1L7XSQ5_9HELO|nr:uncharacterized protein PAC_17928 [Phialocephala subalpina]
MKAGKSIQVVFVGAGMGGLGTAISLRKAGHKVIVLEQAPEFSEVFRPDYHKVLLQAAQSGADVRKTSEVKTYLPEEGAVILVDGTKIRGDLIIAADGVKSIARKAIGVSAEPHETGDSCFRVVILAKKLRADPDLAGLSIRPGFEQWLGPDHHIIGYNVSEEKYFNLLMVIPDDRKVVGYKAPCSATEVKRAYTGWNNFVQKLLTFLPEDVERWRLIDLPPIRGWIHPSNGLLLLGDAIHATLPYLAQRAAMAIEDAAALATSYPISTRSRNFRTCCKFTCEHVKAERTRSTRIIHKSLLYPYVKGTNAGHAKRDIWSW